MQAKKEELRALAKLPPGTKLMPEEQRIETLERLLKEHAEIQEVMQKMPLSMRTEALRNHKRELEEKTNEIERAITTFSRKFVYIASD